MISPELVEKENERSLKLMNMHSPQTRKCKRSMSQKILRSSKINLVMGNCTEQRGFIMKKDIVQFHKDDQSICTNQSKKRFRNDEYKFSTLKHLRCSKRLIDKVRSPTAESEEGASEQIGDRKYS